MDSLPKDFPEVFEKVYEESLFARDAALRDGFRTLGPLDMIHISKSSSKYQSSKNIGSYLFINGSDCSSSASIAALLNSLTQNIILMDPNKWFGKNSWKIHRTVFCCYNSFSKMDVRVEAHIPGSVKAYAIRSDGSKITVSLDNWMETYVSSIVRAIILDGSNNQIYGVKKYDPLATKDQRDHFYQATKILLSRGWMIGSASNSSTTPTINNNFLTDAIIRYFKYINRFDWPLKLFEEAASVDPTTVPTVALCLYYSGEVEKAFYLINKYTIEAPIQNLWPLLQTQIKLLIDMRHYDLALSIALEVVKVASQDVSVWTSLCNIYIQLGRFEEALISLNATPMHAPNDKEDIRMSTPSKVHIPVRNRQDGSGGDSSANEEIDGMLANLQVNALSGCFKKAYKLLCLIYANIGWDQLLKLRAKIFVMEEEYRLQQQLENCTIEGTEMAIKDESKLKRPYKNKSNDFDSSHIPLSKSSSLKKKDLEELQSSTTSLSKDDSVSAQQSIDSIHQLVASIENLEIDEEKEQKMKLILRRSLLEMADKCKSLIQSHEPGTYHRIQCWKTQWDEEEKFTMRNKRLCERWLDHLFGVLYEELKVSMIWRAEETNSKSQQISLRRSPMEWEILGKVNLRIRHFNEAKRAFEMALTITTANSEKASANTTSSKALIAASMGLLKIAVLENQGSSFSLSLSMIHKLLQMQFQSEFDEIRKQHPSSDTIGDFIQKIQSVIV